MAQFVNKQPSARSNSTLRMQLVLRFYLLIAVSAGDSLNKRTTTVTVLHRDKVQQGHFTICQTVGPMKVMRLVMQTAEIHVGKFYCFL